MAKKTDIKWEPDPRIFIFKYDAPGRTKMHVHRLKLKDWVKIDNTYPDQMALRKELWEKRKDKILETNTDESAEACKWEFFEMLVEHLPPRFPDMFDDSKEGFIYNKVLDEWVSTDKSHPEDPLYRAGKLTQDDWCIIEWSEKEQGYVLTSGIVYFPMRWSLREKMNKVIGRIHIPVKSFTKHLKPNVYSLFKKMKPEKPIWRANWALFNDLEGPLDLFADTPSLDRNDVNVVTPYDGNTGRALVFRAEYQTLRKLPRTKCIVFGIRTYQRYIEDFWNSPDSIVEALIRSINDLNEDDVQYKGAEFWRDAAVKYLQNIIDSRKCKSPMSKI